MVITNPKQPILYFFGISAMILIALHLLADFDGLYGQDAYEYLRYSKAINEFFLNGTATGDYFWPLFYPILGGVLNLIIPDTALSIQLISVLAMAVSGVYIYKSLQLLHPENDYAFAYTLLFFICSPYVFKMGVLVMSDMLAGCLIIGCFYHALKYFEHQSPGNIYYAAALGVSAVMTRYAAFVVLLPMGIYFAYFLLKNKKHFWHLPAICLLIFSLTLPHFYIKSQQPFAFLEHGALSQWSIKYFIQKDFVTNEGLSFNSLPNIIYGLSNFFHPRFFALGGLLLIVFTTKRMAFRYQYLILCSIGFYALFLAGIPRQNSRFLLLSFPLVLLFLYPAFSFSFKLIQSRKRQQLLLLLFVAMQIGLCIYSIKPVLQRNKLEQQIVLELKPYQNNTLYAFDMDIALKGRGLTFTYYNLWVTAYSSFEQGALVLFNPAAFEQQWQGKNPMKNWNRLRSDYTLTVEKKLPNGWTLFKIQNIL